MEGGVYRHVEAFVRLHRSCGAMTANVTEPDVTSYRITLACSCGAVFERWVTPGDAKEDLLRSTMAAFPN